MKNIWNKYFRPLTYNRYWCLKVAELLEGAELIYFRAEFLFGTYQELRLSFIPWCIPINFIRNLHTYIKGANVTIFSFLGTYIGSVWPENGVHIYDSKNNIIDHNSCKGTLTLYYFNNPTEKCSCLLHSIEQLIWVSSTLKHWHRHLSSLGLWCFPRVRNLNVTCMVSTVAWPDAALLLYTAYNFIA